MNIVQSLEKSLKTGCCKRPTTLVLSFSLKRSKFNEQSYIISCCKKLVLASSSCGKLQFLALPQWFHALRMYPTLHPLQQAWETCQRPTVFVDLYYCTFKSLLLSIHTFLETRTERNNKIKIKIKIFPSLPFFPKTVQLQLAATQLSNWSSEEWSSQSDGKEKHELTDLLQPVVLLPFKLISVNAGETQRNSQCTDVI